MNILITAIIAAITTAIGSIITFIFTKKKYNAEVESVEITNLKTSVEVYEKITKESIDRLTYYIDLTETLSKEQYRLKSIVWKLINATCLDDACPSRKFYSDDQIKSILQETVKSNNQDENINSSKQEV